MSHLYVCAYNITSVKNTYQYFYLTYIIINNFLQKVIMSLYCYYLLPVFFLYFSLFNNVGVYGKDIKGIVSLDGYTFDKIVSSNAFNILIKFDEEYPYGTQQNEYEKFVNVINEQGQQNKNDFIIGSVVINKKGDESKKENDKEDNDRDDKEIEMTPNENGMNIEKIERKFCETF